jgi:hypothetical protein
MYNKVEEITPTRTHEKDENQFLNTATTTTKKQQQQFSKHRNFYTLDDGQIEPKYVV